MAHRYEYPEICSLLTQWQVRAWLDGRSEFAKQAGDLARSIGNKSYIDWLKVNQLRPILIDCANGHKYFV